MDPINGDTYESIAARARARPEPMATEDDGYEPEFFPLGALDGDDHALGNLIKGALPVELYISLSKTEVPLLGGLLDPDKGGRAAVTYEALEYKQKPIREEQPDGSFKIVSWKVTCNAKARLVEPLGDPEEVVRREFDRLRASDPARASEVVDELVDSLSSDEVVA